MTGRREQDGMRVLAGRSIVAVDEGGEPIAEVREAIARFGTARVDVDVDMFPGGLDRRVPPSVSRMAGERELTWRMPSAFIGKTQGTWTPAEAASLLTRERLHEAYGRSMGRDCGR